MWINKEWLDRIGSKMPLSVEDFYDVMVAFKHYDANGNGDLDDEIPLGTLWVGASYELDGFLMNPFQHTTVSGTNVKRWFVADGGEVTPAFTQPKYRDGLRYLARMWRNGLIDRESVGNTRLRPPPGDVAIYGAVPRRSWPTWMPNWREYVAVPPLLGPAGRQSATGVELFRSGPFLTGNDERRAAIAMKYLDWWYSDEGRVISSLGEEGKWWEAAPPGSLGADGNRAHYVELPTPNEYLAQNGWPMLNYLPIWVRGGGLTFVTTQDPLDVNGAYYLHRFHYLHSNVAEPYRRHIRYRLPELYVDPRDVDVMTRLRTSIDTFVSEATIAFITGGRDIETAWGWFETELERLGLDLLVDLWRKNYEASEYHAEYW